MSLLDYLLARPVEMEKKPFPETSTLASLPSLKGAQDVGNPAESLSQKDKGKGHPSTESDPEASNLRAVADLSCEKSELSEKSPLALAGSMPSGPCPTCQGRRYGVSVHDMVICATCHPPGTEHLVKQRIHLSEPNRPRKPKPSGVKSQSCPYDLPEGVRLVSYTPKGPPVAVTVCSVVTDVPKFIRHALGELDTRLHHPLQIKAGDSVFEMLAKLADSGLELRLEWPPETQIIENSPETEPSKLSKLVEPPELNTHGADIRDEDLPF